MTGADIAAIVTAVGGSIAAVCGGIALVRRKSAEWSRSEEQRCEDCYTWRRTALRVLNQVRDLLAEHGIPEPEGIDDELGSRRAARAVSADESG